MQHTIDQNINEIDPKHPKLYIFQSRVTMDYEKVHDYAQKMKDGTRFNPIEAFIDEIDNIWGYNGKHRQEAAIEAGVMLPITITPGTEKDAELEALGANFDNGLPRSKADEEWAVELGFTKHLLSEREVSRRTKLSRRRVGNIKKDLVAAGKIPADYKPTVKRGKSEYVQNTEKIGSTRNLSGASVADSQMEIIETYFIVPELQSFVRTYCTGDRKERRNYLQNITMATVAGRAYLREIEQGLQYEGRQQGKKYRKNELMQAVKNLQEELDALTCAGPACDFRGKDAQIFFLNNKWYCSRCAEKIQEKLTMPSEEGDSTVLDNLIMQQLEHDQKNDTERLNRLREIMFNASALGLLVEQIPGFPPKVLRERCRILYDNLSKAPKPAKAKCSGCEYHRAKMNTHPGKLIGHYYHGKCIQEGGLCDDVAAIVNPEKGNVATKYCPDCGKMYRFRSAEYEHDGYFSCGCGKMMRPTQMDWTKTDAPTYLQIHCEQCNTRLSTNKPAAEYLHLATNKMLCDACRQQATTVFQEASHKTEEGTYYSDGGITVNDIGERFGQTTYIVIEDRTAFDALNLAETQSEKVDTKDVVYGKNRIIFQFWKSQD